MGESRLVVSVDPGDVNNGLCFFKYDVEKKRADTLIMDVFSPKIFSQRLMQIFHLGQATSDYKEMGKNPKMFFVVENFRVDSKVRGAMFQWNDMKTSRAIGKVEFVAEALNAQCVLQEPRDVFPMARKWAPFKMAQHPRDDQSAWCHGVHFMMNRKWIMTPDQVNMFGQEKL